MEWCSRSLNIPASIADWKPGDVLKEGVISVFEPEFSPALNCSLLQFGSPNKDTGLAMASYIEAAVELTQGEVLGGIITCPIAKSTLNMAGYAYPGHTEMLASLCRTSDYAMMMAGGKLRVTLVTIHTGLAQVSQALSMEKNYSFNTPDRRFSPERFWYIIISYSSCRPQSPCRRRRVVW